MFIHTKIIAADNGRHKVPQPLVKFLFGKSWTSELRKGQDPTSHYVFHRYKLELWSITMTCIGGHS